jgi:hypothetical protein
MAELNSIKFKVNWRLLLTLLAFAWLVNKAANVIVDSVEMTSWTRALVLVVGDVSYVAFVLLALASIGTLIAATINFLAGLFPASFGLDQEPKAEVIDQADGITHTLRELGRYLDDIERNRDQAIQKLQDADMLASTLVALIRRTIAKARSVTRECELMETALNALVSGDSLSIARAAGRLNDDHIRDLMLEMNGDDGYRTSLLHLLATQTGVLRSQSEALRELSNTWIDSLTRQRAQMARLSLVIDALDAARPVASIEARLKEAQSYLMMQGNPELHQVTRALPTAGAGGPMIEGYK